VQPANTITHESRIATVAVLAAAGGVQATTRYTVGFGPLDVVVPHVPLTENSNTDLWVHGPRRHSITIMLVRDGQMASTSTGTSDARGWLKVPFHAPTPIGHPSTIDLTVTARIHSRLVSTHGRFQVREFQFGVSLHNLQVMHRQGAAWVAADQVRLGENVRFSGIPGITEPAGNAVLCVAGTVVIRRAGVDLMTVPLQCITTDQGPLMVADTRFTDPATTGNLQAVFHVTFQNAQATYTLPFTLLAA
jgi:hypothetical protein